MANNTLRIDIRCRNNVLWHAIFDRWPSVSAFARDAGIWPGRIGDFLNLQDNPYVDDGVTLKPIAAHIASALGQHGHEVFPWELYQEKFPTKAVYEVEAEQFVSLNAARRLSLEGPSVDSNVIDKALATLTPRERNVIEKRYNFTGNDPEATYRDIGDDLSLSPERVRQIENKALRKLRHPSRQMTQAMVPEERTAVADPIRYRSQWNWHRGERVQTPEGWTGTVRNQRVRSHREEILVENAPFAPGRWFWGLDLRRVSELIDGGLQKPQTSRR